AQHTERPRRRRDRQRHRRCPSEHIAAARSAARRDRPLRRAGGGSNRSIRAEPSPEGRARAGRRRAAPRAAAAAAFIGSAFAIGLIAARFAKSSAKDARDDYADMRWSSRDRNVAGTYGAGSRAAMAHEVSRPAVAHDVTASTSAGETSESGRTARTGRATSATGARTRRQGPETERS